MTRLTRWMDRTFYPDFVDRWDDRLFEDRVRSTISPQSVVLDLGAGAGLGGNWTFRASASCLLGSIRMKRC